MARTSVDYLELLPTVLHDVIEIDAIAKVEKPFLDGEWYYVNASIDNNFVQTANEEGVKRYEDLLGLVAPGTDDLQTRKLRVLARMQEQAPYTNRVLVRILDSLLGEDKYLYTRDIANKIVNVKLELTVKRQLDILVETLERILPANMIYSVELRYNTHEKVSEYTHEQLANFTQENIREGVI